jgi:hypothetical protein
LGAERTVEREGADFFGVRVGVCALGWERAVLRLPELFPGCTVLVFPRRTLGGEVVRELPRAEGRVEETLPGVGRVCETRLLVEGRLRITFTSGVALRPRLGVTVEARVRTSGRFISRRAMSCTPSRGCPTRSWARA